jgi:anti-sigma B factor antagonist
MSFIHTLTSKDPVAVITLYGELIDRNEAQELTDLVHRLSEEGQNRIVLDLSELKYMNSTGLNVLINVLTRTRKNGGDLVICGVSKKVSELLLITKLNSVFTVTDTAEEAVARFKS